MNVDRNPEVLAQWTVEVDALASGAKLFVAAALVYDTFSSRNQAAEWFRQCGAVLGNVEVQGCLGVLKQ